MTGKQMNEVLVTLDNVWDGLDEGREAGYRWVLEEHDFEPVMEAVRELAQEDRQWLPKPPEIAARVHRVLAEQRRRQRRERLVADLNLKHELEARLAMRAVERGGAA